MGKIAKRKIQKNQGKRAVIYARYSSANQREASIEQQVEWCTALAGRYQLQLVDTYADKAISGRSDNRPSFQRMMRDARAGKFDYVLAWKSSRMGRNMLEAMINDAALREQSVTTIYVEEDFEDNAAGRFALRNMMNVNQFYSEALAEDVKRGMMDNAKKCMVNGKVSYGFRKGKDGRYEIIPEEAEIIREIFFRIIDGWQQRDILDDLNLRGIRTHGGNEWARQSFGTLLRNEQYIGVYSYNGIRIEDGIPAILDRETFEEVQTILTTKKNPRGRQRNVEDYLLTGKLFCGNCKKPMVGICGTSKTGERHYYYLCQGKHNKLVCDKKNERKEKIEQAVINAVKELILDDQTIDWIIDGYQQFMEQARGESAVTAMEKELADTEKGIDNLMRAIEMGIITNTTKARMIELEDKKKELEARIRIESRMLMELDPDQLRFSIERFRDKNINNKKYQKELINTFVKAVYVFDDHLKLVLNRGPGDEQEIPFEEMSAVGVEETGASCVRINANKAYQSVPVRTQAITIQDYGIVVVVSY